MLETIIHFLSKRLHQDLPFKHIEDEDIDPLLRKFIVDKQNHPNYHPRICAVMITLFEKNGKVYIPCILRPQKNRFHAGQIAFPGGGREKQDRDLNETAIRETFEEIGIKISRYQIIGNLTNMYVPPSNSLITPIVAFLNSQPSYRLNPNEVDQIIEIPIEDLLNSANHITKTITVQKGVQVQMPAIQSGTNIVWGATARIMKELGIILQEIS